jgi:CDP-ribitol ribitolphosphotransferase
VTARRSSPSSDAGAARPRLATLTWERIQLVVRLRDPAAAVRHADLRLLRIDAGETTDDGDAPEPMMATWSARRGDEVVARFNIMLGPGQRPLTSGIWQLATADGALRMADPDPIEAFLAERVFRYPGGRYRVSPSTDADALLVEVRNRRSRRRGSAFSARRWKRSFSQRRQRLFRSLIEWHRRRTQRTGRLVLFTSDSHASLAGNLAIVHRRMVERGLDREYRLETLFKPGITASRSWRDRWRLPRLLATADVILLDDFQPAIYHLEPAPGQRIVQLWHASGAFKTVGYSRVGKPGGPSPYSRRHKNYTHATVSGGHDVPYYAEAFGLPEDRVIPTGIPRMDRFFDESQQAAGRELAHGLFPQIDGRMAILFAPTFRGRGPRDAWYDYEHVDWPALHAVCEARDAAVVVKMHPFISEPAAIPEPLRDRIVDGTHAAIDVNDLLLAVDLLVTDYSSIVFEYSVLQRPMLFFAYDLDEYVASRDFYVPFEEFVPGRIARTFDELLAAIRDDDYEAEKVAAFARRHFDHLDGRATDRIIDELILSR